MIEATVIQAPVIQAPVIQATPITKRNVIEATNIIHHYHLPQDAVSGADDPFSLDIYSRRRILLI